MQTYTDTQLDDAFQSNQPPVLIDLLGDKAFDRGHLPYAINVPYGAKFAERVEAEVPERATKVVLYSTQGQEKTREAAALELEAAGYRKVAIYDGDAASWNPSAKALRDPSPSAHQGPKVVGTPHLGAGPEARRAKLKAATGKKKATFRAKATDFALKRLLRRVIPGWNWFAAFGDIKAARATERDETASSRDRKVAWGAAAATSMGATNIPVLSSLGAMVGAGLSWLRDRRTDHSTDADA